MMTTLRGSMRSALIAVLAGTAVAGGARQAAAAPVGAAARTIAAPRLSLAQAVKLVEQRFRARVVRAETREQGNRTIYVLRLLDGTGRVFTVRVDASSGRIL